jgi:beta-lactamase regulating signal transducer with metallopeptidase domain
MLQTLLSISASVSILILILLLASKWINRKFRPQVKYWLWLVIALRLMVPLSVTLPQGAASLPLVHQAAQVQSATQARLFQDTVPAAAAPSEAAASPAASASFSAVSIPALSLKQVLPILYVLGLALFLLYYLAAYHALRRRLRRWAHPAQNQYLEDRVAVMARRVGVAPPQLLVLETLHTPMVVGIRKPVLVLPWEKWDAYTLQHVLCHELIHLRRRDTLYKAFLLVTNAVHWFNPLVWLMRRRAEQDLEISCDASALQNASSQAKRQYSESILLVAGQVPFRDSSITTAFSSTKQSLKERFAEIYRKGTRRKGLLLLAVATVFAVLSGCVVSANILAADADNTASSLSDESSAEIEAVSSAAQDISTQDASAQDICLPDSEEAAMVLSALRSASGSEAIPQETKDQLACYILDHETMDLLEQFPDWDFYVQSDGSIRLVCSTLLEDDGTYFNHTFLYQSGTILWNLGSLTQDDMDALRATGTLEFPDTLFTARYATTNSTDSYRSNLALACEAISGIVLQPGETFSFNEIVGERTEARGYQLSSMAIEDTDLIWGGGVDAVSNGLYDACLGLGLEILEQESDSAVAYGTPGSEQNAAVSYGGDFRFRNTRNEPIRIDTVTEGRYVHVAIQGTR